MKNTFHILIIIVGITACVRSQVINPNIVAIDDIGISWQRDILYIDFQEGFEKTPVILSVKNKTIFSDKITTKQDGTGFAASTQTKMPLKNTLIQLMLWANKCNVLINPSKGNFIGIKILDNHLQIEQSKNPFFYD